MDSGDFQSPKPAGTEFRGRKFIVVAAAFGLSAGMTATMFYSLGAFVPSLQAEFGWSRADISLAVSIMTVGLFLAGPYTGRLCDRFGAAYTGAASLLLYSIAVAWMTLTVSRLEVFWVAYFAIAILGAGSTPIVLVRPISAHFDRQRGLALGIALTGAGLAGFWVPNLVASVSVHHGWRAAYLALATCAALVAPLVWLGFRNADHDRLGTRIQAALDGLSLSEARKTRTYWTLLLMALTMALGIAGMIVHLVPLFRDLGAEAGSAARIASLVGVSSVVGRIAVGVLLDRFSAWGVSLAILSAATLGLLLLWIDGLIHAVPAVILLGLAAGAEIDLLAYLTARHFGQRAYGAIYGWQYSVFALGYGFSPFFVGRLRDSFGNYEPAILASALLMGLAALAALSLAFADRGDASRARQ